MTEREIQRLIVSLTAGPEHERLYAALIRRAGVAISPAESWALWYVAAYGPIDTPRLTARLNLDAGRAVRPDRGARTTRVRAGQRQRCD